MKTNSTTAAPIAGKYCSPYFLCENNAEHMKDMRVSEAHTSNPQSKTPVKDSSVIHQLNTPVISPVLERMPGQDA